MKECPSLTEVLENARIFYEAQYKEVKVVANVSLGRAAHQHRAMLVLKEGQAG